MLYYLDIGIKFWNVRKCFSRIFLYTFYEDFSPISRYPDVMIFCFIDSMGTLATSYTLSYQILTRLDSHYITRQESGVLCGSIKFLMNIALGAVLLSNAICLNDFDGNGLIGFVVLMGFTFMSILILLAANYNDL